MKQLIDDPHYGNNFGDREFGINDEFGRGDLEIFAECAQSDFPLDKFPECKYPDIMETYTMDEAHIMAQNIFEDNIKYILPYTVMFWGNKREVVDYARENTTCRVRIYSSYMLFEDKNEHALVYLKYKKPYEYQPTLYTVQLEVNDGDYYDDALIKWIKENLGEFKWVCDHGYTIAHQYTFAFYSHEDAAMFKLRWVD